ncbi:hypothetical protein PNA2_0731 [Pyrococcus sp. NA2]|uniref:metal-dependent hydrolase n=1 Tax=Pyrococcus sp. (strain NA2) TaxID=342949 RepID=UPI000209ADE7|nr:metal-dependent hydrolase [Pyrococcus sp. NA2]AEC51646.1 hypothetical protein PNA2_0731 [Pyrococcus sp. NA2]
MNYEEHVLAGLITYPIFVALLYFLQQYIPLDLSYLPLVLGYAFYVLGSDLPDIDHPDSIIHRGVKPIFSIIVGSTVALRTQHIFPSYQPIFSWALGGVSAFISWFIFSALMPRHRGIVHSVFSALVYGFLSFIAVKYGIKIGTQGALVVALAAFSGYMLHLMLDRSVKLI